MSKKKNRFREWLSDNLRYIVLGFAMLVILALLYIGFCLLVMLVDGTQLKEEQAIENQQEEVSGDLEEDESVNSENVEDDSNNDTENEDESIADETVSGDSHSETDDETQNESDDTNVEGSTNEE